MNNSFWKNKKVLITGDTGFKGSWLSFVLNKLGAKVKGVSADIPTNPSLYNILNLSRKNHTQFEKITNRKQIEKVVHAFKPEIIFHLAAQSLVRKSYKNPLETFNVNVMGTATLLDILRNNKSCRVIVNVTSDKCYKMDKKSKPYNENDPLGGNDPYSASKACAELVSHSFFQSYFSNKQSKLTLATVRAGNVIGGGDWAEDRLIPDVIKSLSEGKKVSIRNPDAIRPWQHVLEPVCGYIRLARFLYQHPKKYQGAWNFGPSRQSHKPVCEVVKKIIELWGEGSWSLDKKEHPKESKILKLNCSKSNKKLNWKPKLKLNETLEMTVNWYKDYFNNKDLTRTTENQIERYLKL